MSKSDFDTMAGMYAPSAPSIPNAGKTQAATAPNGSSTGSDNNAAWEGKMFEAYLRLLEIADLGSYVGAGEGELDEAHVPRMALVGMESQGKSSLLQVFLGFPCAFIKGGTGTRCPVQYVLRHKPGVTEHEVKFEGRPCGAEELANKIQDHMSKLAQEPVRFVDTILKVEVAHESYINIVLLDLPGIRVGTPEVGYEAEKDFIDKLVSSYIKRTDHFLLLVGKCERVNSDPLVARIGLLQEGLRPEWETHCLYVATHFDYLIDGAQLSAIDAANLFYNTELHHQREAKFKYCVELKGYDKRADTFEKQKAHIKSLEGREEKHFEEWMYQIAPEKKGPGPDGWRSTFAQLDSDFRSHLGIANTMRAIRKRFYELIVNEARKWMDPLQRNLLIQEAEIKRLDEQIKTHGNASQLRLHFQEVVRNFLTTLRDVSVCAGEIANYFNTWTFQDETMWLRTLSLDQDKQLFRDDWEAVLNAMKKQAPGSGLEEELKLMYLGSRQIERALKIHKYLVLSFPTTDWNDQTLQQPCLGYLSGNNTKLDYDKGVREMVYRDLSTNLTGMSNDQRFEGVEDKGGSSDFGEASLSWLFDHVLAILAHNGATSLDVVLRRKGLVYLRGTPFQRFLEKEYLEVVKEMTKAAREQFLGTVVNHIKYIVHDRLAEVKRIQEAVPKAKSLFPNRRSAPQPTVLPGFDGSSKPTTPSKQSPTSGSPVPDIQYDLQKVDDSLGEGIPVNTFKFSSSGQASRKRPGLNFKTIAKLCARDHVETPAHPSSAEIAALVTEAYYSQLMFLLVELEHNINQNIVSEVQENIGSVGIIRERLEKAVAGISETRAIELRKFDIEEAKRRLQKHTSGCSLLRKAMSSVEEALHCLPNAPANGFYTTSFN